MPGSRCRPANSARRRPSPNRYTADTSMNSAVGRSAATAASAASSFASLSVSKTGERDPQRLDQVLDRVEPRHADEGVREYGHSPETGHGLLQQLEALGGEVGRLGHVDPGEVPPPDAPGWRRDRSPRPGSSSRRWGWCWSPASRRRPCAASRPRSRPAPAGSRRRRGRGPGPTSFPPTGARSRWSGRRSSRDHGACGRTAGSRAPPGPAPASPLA